MSNRLWDDKHKAFMAAIKTMRLEAGINQTELADRLGKPQSYVSKYESGERKVDFVEVLDICNALGTKPQALVELYEQELCL